MEDTLMSIQIVPRTSNNGNVIPYIDEAIKITDESGLHFRAGPLETIVQGNANERLILIQSLNERMVGLGCPSIISRIKSYHAPDGTIIETLTERYNE